MSRDIELTQLHRWLVKALNGVRQVVFVTGEPGIGKTTFIDAFFVGVGSDEEFGAQRLKRQSPNSELTATPASLDWPWGQCIDHYGVGEAYLPVLEALGPLVANREENK